MSAVPAPIPAFSATALIERFTELDRFLHDNQYLWKPTPFTARQMPWEWEHPDLAAWLRNQPFNDDTHNTPHDVLAPAPYPALAKRSRVLSNLPELMDVATYRTVIGQDMDVPGRKWRQLEAFCRKLLPNGSMIHWLDWCAGKGHLARYLATAEHPSFCLEVDSALVEQGKALSHKLQRCVHHHQQNVLACNVGEWLTPEVMPVALHACGDLHRQLLRQAAQAGCTQMAIAPCCYDRTEAPVYQPLSQTAQNSTLLLKREDLRLPLCETVTAGKRTRRDRDLSMARRLGFDALQRALSGQDRYLPTPPLPTAWLRLSFADYCIELAKRKDFRLPSVIDWAHWEAAGVRRLTEVRNLELVRALFRRPLELWLVLDQVLFLVEAGYQVQLGTFCASNITPRNIMLIARR